MKAPAATARGSTVVSTLGFLRREYGEAARDKVLGQLAEDLRVQVTSVEATGQIPFELLARLLQAIEAALGTEYPQLMEKLGANAIASGGIERYGGILRKASPREFLMQPVSLFKLFYHPGNMEVVAEEEERAVLRLVGFPAAEPLFCRRQTGGLERAVELAGGVTPRVRHVRCVVEEDAFCEWVLDWS